MISCISLHLRDGKSERIKGFSPEHRAKVNTTVIKTQVYCLANNILPVKSTSEDSAALSLSAWKKPALWLCYAKPNFGYSVLSPSTEHSTPQLKDIKVSMNLLDTYFPSSIAGSGARK